MSDVIETTSKAVQEARNKAITSVKAYAQPKIVSAIIEMIISIFIIMGVQLMTFGFDISKLLTWVFWMRTGLLSIGIFVLYRAVINARYPTTDTRDSVLEIKEKYIEKCKLKSLFMKQWLKEVFNVQTKTEAWVDHWNKKIYKLENKIIRSYNPKKKEKWENQIEYYKTFITAEYIVKHIDTIRVKYYIVYYNDFQDISPYGRSGGVMSRGDYNKAFNFASFNKMWVYVLTTAMLGVSVITLDTISTASVLVALGSTAFMCTTRIVTALLEADTLYDNTITASLLGRIEILEEWEKYNAEHPSLTTIESEKSKIEKVLREEIKIEYDKVYDDKLEVEKKILRAEFEKIIREEERVA